MESASTSASGQIFFFPNPPVSVDEKRALPFFVFVLRPTGYSWAGGRQHNDTSTQNDSEEPTRKLGVSRDSVRLGPLGPLDWPVAV